MVLLMGAALIAGGLFARSEYEKHHFSIEEVTVVSTKIQQDCTGVFLSDLHNNQFGKGNHRLIEAIHRINPDMILMGGDMMVCKGKRGIEIPLHLIRQLSLNYPVYYGNGNHELRMKRERHIYGSQYDVYKEELQRCGVQFLENQSAYFRKDIRITGIDLEDKYYKKRHIKSLTEEDIKKKAGEAEQVGMEILLCHSPLYFNACKAWGADLTLSGHFHGGTIRLPILGGVMSPQIQFFHPWCFGTFKEGERYMVVSRGLGTHSVNIRLNNKPQLVVLRIKSDRMGEVYR